MVSYDTTRFIFQVMVTLTEIAQMADVSRSAVSHVINGRGGKLSKEKRGSVETLLRDHRYQRNGLVRALKAKRTHSLAVMVPSVRFSYYTQVIDAMEVRAREHGYHLYLVQTHMDPAIVRREINHLRERRVDGFLVVPVHKDMAIYEELSCGGDPLVLVDSYLAGGSVPYVDTDDYQGAVLAAQQLLENGHRSFLIHAAKPDDVSPMATERLRGYSETLVAAGIAPSAVCIKREALDIERGSQVVQTALREGIKFSAVLSLTDMSAIGAMRALQEAGFSVPGDISVVGYGNIEQGRYLTPPLTTIHQSPDRVGMESIDLMLELLAGKKPASRMIAPELVVRGSTGKFPALCPTEIQPDQS